VLSNPKRSPGGDASSTLMHLWMTERAPECKCRPAFDSTLDMRFNVDVAGSSSCASLCVCSPSPGGWVLVMVIHTSISTGVVRPYKFIQDWRDYFACRKGEKQIRSDLSGLLSRHTVLYSTWDLTLPLRRDRNGLALSRIS
jgi:hypothetical protein